MKLFRNTAASTIAVSAALIGSLYPICEVQAQSVSDRILSDVTAQTVGACSTVTVTFNVRVQFLSFFPQTAGRELHIRVKPLEGNSLSRESLRTPAGVSALRSIEFEGDNSTGPILTLVFKRDVVFDVAAGEKAQTIVITISEPGSLESCRANQPSAAEPVPANAGTSAVPEPNASMPQATVPVPSGLYVINLLSQTKDVSDLSPALADKVADLLVYETRFERDGQTWFRLRAGFFESRADAEAARQRLAKDFPEAWVVKVTSQEREQGVTTRLASGANGTPTATLAVPKSALTDADKAAMAKSEADAGSALKAGDNDRAIQLLTRALSYPENDRSPRARELLGLARERKNQSAQARAEYEEYLRRYPDGEGADRVKQRLAGLTNPGSAAEGPTLRAASGNAEAKANAWHWGVRGSFSQFYFRDQSSSRFLTTTPLVVNDRNSDPVVDNAVNLNQLLTNADATITAGNDRAQVLARVSASYTKSFRAKTPIKDPVTDKIVGFRTGDIKTLSALYVDGVDNVTGISARLGRQTRNGSGILGRFDGGLVGWQAKPKLKLNLAAGTPVSRARDLFIRSDRFFYGASVDIGSKSDSLQTTVYWYDERSPGLIDRQAIGAEGRYIKGAFNAYTIIDYDVHYKKLSLGLLTLNYSMKDQSSISITADVRQSPLLNTWTLINGISPDVIPGRTLAIDNIYDLQSVFTDSQIYRLAADNTIVTKSVTASYSRPLTKKLQTNLDFTWTNTGGSLGSTRLFPGSKFLTPQLATGSDFFYGGQLIGSGLLFNNDIYILGGRYADTQLYRTYTGDINARIPITSKLRISPRGRYGYRANKLDAGFSRQIQPTFRLNYYPIKQSEIEIEVGGNFTKQRQFQATPSGPSITNSSEKGLFLSLGYRLDF
jgi:tetratricopeptide (TPR) repeat protein